MTRYSPNSQLRFDIEVRNSAGSLVDPTTITFHWKTTRGGTDTTETVTRDGLGLYHAFATPTEGGALFIEFRCTNPDFVKPDFVYVEPSRFEFAWNDYGN